MKKGKQGFPAAQPTKPGGHDSFPEEMTLKVKCKVWGETKGRNQESRSRQRNNMSSCAKTLWSEGLNGSERKGEGREPTCREWDKVVGGVSKIALRLTLAAVGTGGRGTWPSLSS